ncbi:MAG TPA: hypothetical protein VJK90_11895, partial [Acetobacteraceae bacterium]|nr:hypothetical protein [Acetobacteraceae bacterium]
MAFECAQVHPSGIPDRTEIDIGITMAQRIARPISQRPRHVGMCGNKVRVVLLYVSRGFSDDLQVTDDRILRAGVRVELEPIKTRHVDADPADRIQHVADVLGRPSHLSAYTGFASARTRSRSAPRSPPEVVTWT